MSNCHTGEGRKGSYAGMKDVGLVVSGKREGKWHISEETWAVLHKLPVPLSALPFPCSLATGKSCGSGKLFWCGSCWCFSLAIKQEGEPKGRRTCSCKEGSGAPQRLCVPCLCWALSVHPSLGTGATQPPLLKKWA